MGSRLRAACALFGSPADIPSHFHTLQDGRLSQIDTIPSGHLPSPWAPKLIASLIVAGTAVAISVHSGLFNRPARENGRLRLVKNGEDRQQ